MNQSFTDFVQTKSNDPKRSIITETISDELWKKLIDKIKNIKDKIISISDCYMNSDFEIKDNGTNAVVFGKAIFNLQQDRVIEVDESTEGTIKIKDKTNIWGIIHFKTN